LNQSRGEEGGADEGRVVVEVELLAQCGVQRDEGGFGGGIVGRLGACRAWTAEEGGDGDDVAVSRGEKSGEEGTEDVKLCYHVHIESSLGQVRIGGRVYELSCVRTASRPRRLGRG